MNTPKQIEETDLVDVSGGAGTCGDQPKTINPSLSGSFDPATQKLIDEGKIVVDQNKKSLF